MIESLENQAALINRFLDYLQRAMQHAPTAQHAVFQQEIEYQLRELMRVHRQRDAAQQRLAANEGKKAR